MFGLIQGTVYASAKVAAGAAKLYKQNTQAQAQADSKLLLRVNRKKLYLNVAEVIDDGSVIASGTQNDIIISPESGIHAVTGSYRRISDSRYHMGKALGTKKGRVTAFCTVGSICTAAAASIAASQKEHCTGLGCVRWYIWLLIAATALLSTVAWYRDNAL